MLIASVFMHNVPDAVVAAQRRVLESLKAEDDAIVQLRVSSSHGDALDHILSAWPHYNVYLLLDIDAIPLCSDVVDEAYWAAAQGEIYGVRGIAQHLDPKFEYAHPSFLAFSRRIFDQLGRPSFVPTSKYDVGGLLTARAREDKVHVTKLPALSCQRELPWSYDNVGSGTTYGWSQPLVYHQFCIRDGHRQDVDAFLTKCEEVVGE